MPKHSRVGADSTCEPVQAVRACRAAAADSWHDARSKATRGPVEFLNLLLIFTAGFLVWRKPERERLAFGLFVTSVLLTIALFLIGTRTSILPPFNY